MCIFMFFLFKTKLQKVHVVLFGLNLSIFALLIKLFWLRLDEAGVSDSVVTDG